MYTFYWWFVGLFLVRRCTVTLTNGQVVRWKRPKAISSIDYRAVFEGWRSARGARIKLDSGNAQLVISADNIVSVEIR